MALEVFIAKEYLASKLKNDPILTTLLNRRVYDDDVPNNATFPYIVFTKQSEQLVRNNNKIIAAKFSFLVKALGKGTSFLVIKDHANRLDEVLDNSTGETTEGIVLSCIRESSFEFSEVDPSGVIIKHLGGSYRLDVQFKI